MSSEALAGTTCSIEGRVNAPNGLELTLQPASVGLIKDVFMRIEQPDVHGAPGEPDVFETLGQFYHALEIALTALSESHDLFANHNSIVSIRILRTTRRSPTTPRTAAVFSWSTISSRRLPPSRSSFTRARD